MRLPKIILAGLKKSKCMERNYPKDRPNLEQVRVELLLLSNQEGPCGFLVCRFLRKKNGPEDTILETNFHENFYEPKEILAALQDYHQNVIPERGSTPFKNFQPRPWKKAPRLTLEKKPIPTSQTQKEDKFEKITHSDHELQIGDIA